MDPTVNWSQGQDTAGTSKRGWGAQWCQNLGKTVFSALRILKSICKLVAEDTGVEKVLSLLLLVFFSLLRSHVSVVILVLQTGE